MTAAALKKVFGAALTVRLVESEEIGTVGVGEATVPHLSFFNKLLEIDEVEFVRQTKGTFKLGIQFNDWARIGDSYVHGFGTAIGHDLGMLPFHQYWIRAFKAHRAKEIGTYTLNTLAAPRGKFMASPIDAPPNTPLASIAYAYHFDAGLYAQYLRRYAEARGAQRTEGKIRDVRLQAGNGFVSSVVLENGTVIEGDLFVDCSGFRGLLIEEALHTGYRGLVALAALRPRAGGALRTVGPPTPYTRCTARAAGWQWRIPLQHRTGNGYVYSSLYISDEEAALTLLQNLDGGALGEPRQAALHGGQAQADLESQRGRHRPLERIYRTAGVHQHLSHSVQRHAVVPAVSGQGHQSRGG